MPTHDSGFIKPMLSELIEYFDNAGGVLTRKDIKKFLGLSSEHFRELWIRRNRFEKVGQDLFRLSDRILKQRIASFNGGIIRRPEQYIELPILIHRYYIINNLR